MNKSYEKLIKTRTTAFILGTLSVLVLSLMPTGSVFAQDGEQVIEYVQQTGEMLNTVSDLVVESGSERARRIFGEARRRHEQSLELLSSGHYAMAFTLSKRAREGARQAQRLARTASSFEERARRYISRLKDLHENVRDRALDSGNKRAMKFVKEAERLFQRAKHQFHQTHYEVAFNLLKSAEKQLKRAARILYEDGGAEKLEREINRIAELINKAEENMPANPDRALVKLLNDGKESFKKAQMAFNNNEPLKAMQQLKKSRSLVKKLLRQIGNRHENINLEQLFERFDQKLIEMTEADSVLVAEAKNIRNQAEQALKDGNKKVALRKIRTALNLLTRAGENSR